MRHVADEEMTDTGDRRCCFAHARGDSTCRVRMDGTIANEIDESTKERVREVDHVHIRISEAVLRSKGHALLGRRQDAGQVVGGAGDPKEAFRLILYLHARKCLERVEDEPLDSLSRPGLVSGPLECILDERE